MKRTILLTFTVLALAAPLAWGNCEDSSCQNSQHSEQSPTGTAPETQPGAKGTPRGFSMDDVVVGERPLEKDCDRADCRDVGKPQPDQRAPEKKGGTGSCGDENC
jgi:hypothetical protein